MWACSDRVEVANKLGLNPRMSPEVMTFMTANGITKADQKVDLIMDEMKDTISPFMMEASPSILSIGKRCAENGYGFSVDARGGTYRVRRP